MVSPTWRPVGLSGMREPVPPYTVRHDAFALAAVSAFLLRPASYRQVLDWTGPQERSFDLHGYGLLLDLALRALEAPLFAHVLYRVLRRGTLEAPLLATAATFGRTSLSWLALLVLGTPTWAQWDAMTSLTIPVAWPVWASAAFWFGIAAMMRAAAVAAPSKVP